MGQITSRKELEEWLKDKPADWAQVIAVRAALRVLPYGFDEPTLKEWLDSNALSLIRAIAIAWAARNFSAHHSMVTASDAAAYVVSNASADTLDDTSKSFATVAAYAAEVISTIDAAAYNADYAAAIVASTAFSAANGAAAASAAATVWANTSYDCNWLKKYPDPELASCQIASIMLWRVGVPVSGWHAKWDYRSKRPRGLDAGYQVWIDWYNRRIEGHDAAFYIPGDIDRVHDKAILARLADATDEDFWGKGATYVNTTLQRWIDEAREQAAIDYVASGAPLKLGSEAELAARDELVARFAEMEAELARAQDQIASLTNTGHGRMGHNQPPDDASLRQEEMALVTQRVAELETTVGAMAAAFAKLNSAIPAASAVVAEAAQAQAVEAVAELVENAPKLGHIARALKFLEDKTSPEVRKGFENAAGAALFTGVASAPYFAYVTLPNAITAFLHHFYTVWFPILPG
jgi:hypothetical protein